MTMTKQVLDGKLNLRRMYTMQGDDMSILLTNAFSLIMFLHTSYPGYHIHSNRAPSLIEPSSKCLNC